MPTALSRDGTTIAYDVTGSGPALVYVTGATCHRRYFPILDDVKAFSQEFTVYCYDRRGRGESDDTLPYAVEREVEDLEAILVAAGGRASVYGHSSGAVLGLEAALALPQRVDKLVVYDAPYVADQAEKESFGRLGDLVRSRLASGDSAGVLKTFLKGIGMPGVFVTLLPLFPGWSTLKRLAPTLVYDIALTADLAPLERLAQLQVPTLVLAGQKSPESVRAVARALGERLGVATQQEVPGQDHLVSAKVLLPLLKGYLTT